MRTNPRISATIRPDQRIWVDAHPEVNVSGLLQKAIDELMAIDELINKRS